MHDDMDADRAVPMAVDALPEVRPMVARIESVSVYSYFDTWKKTYDMYTSKDWYKITEKDNED